ncbi:heme-binding protein 2-like [Rhinophrynus dorsalis]
MNPRWLVLLSLLSFCSSVVAGEEKASDGDKYPRFCRNHKCPKYQLVKKYDTFEHRIYEASNWVTTTLELDFLGLGIATSFRHLFEYISGKNSEGMEIKMTVPVRIQVPSKNASFANATMSLFVPPTVANPPTPKNPAVYLEHFPPKSVYVKTFGGYALKSDFEKMAKVLEKDLVAQGKPFDDSYGTAAAYNDPFTFFDRHNEVWYTVLEI